MSAPRNEHPSYGRLKEAIAEDPQVRRGIRRARMALLSGVGVLLVAWVLAWDVDMESVSRPEFFRDPTPHEAFLLALLHRVGENEGLELDWEEAALRAVDAPLRVGPAYQEAGLLPPELPHALGLRIHIPEGQRLYLEVAEESQDSLRFFLDVFRAPPDTLRRPAHVESGDIVDGHWTFDADQAGDYVIRLQPELFRGGRYRLAVRVGARWRMPVAGANRRDIGSFFGDPRDGGTRLHQGIDIFAPRGTPVLAATDGYASMVDTTGNGGINIWQIERGGRYAAYYAHLDRVLVRRGQGFRRGDTIGLVGNTGNARTTPPHLHFGAFIRPIGPVDPMNLLFPISPEPPPVLANLDGLGEEARASGQNVCLRRSPSHAGPVLRELQDGACLRVLAAAEDWYRVLLPDGETGYLPSHQIEVSASGGPSR